MTYCEITSTKSAQNHLDQHIQSVRSPAEMSLLTLINCTTPNARSTSSTQIARCVSLPHQVQAREILVKSRSTSESSNVGSSYLQYPDDTIKTIDIVSRFPEPPVHERLVPIEQVACRQSDAKQYKNLAKYEFHDQNPIVDTVYPQNQVVSCLPTSCNKKVLHDNRNTSPCNVANKKFIDNSGHTDSSELSKPIVRTPLCPHLIDRAIKSEGFCFRPWVDGTGLKANRTYDGSTSPLYLESDLNAVHEHEIKSCYIKKAFKRLHQRISLKTYRSKAKCWKCRLGLGNIGLK